MGQPAGHDPTFDLVRQSPHLPAPEDSGTRASAFRSIPPGPPQPDDVRTNCGPFCGQRAGNLRVMFPLISTLLSFASPNVLADVMGISTSTEYEYINQMPVGMMVEVPAP